MDDFGLILNCAVRYALGRRSYMPGAVIGYIEPRLGELDVRTLYVLDQDITEQRWCGGYGDPNIDEPQWMKFHAKVREELSRRGRECYKTWRAD